MRSLQWMTATLLLAVAASARADATADLHRLLDEEWQRGLRENPESATYVGDRRHNDRWSDLSLAAFEARQQARQSALDRLAQIDRTQLPPPEQLNYDLFERLYRLELEEHGYRRFLVPLDQRGGVQLSHDIAELVPFDRAKDFEDWISRLEKLPELIAQNTALMRQGLKEKRLPPRVIMERIPGQIRKQVVERAADSPLFAPFRGDTDKTRAARAAKIIERKVVPAYRDFLAFVEGTYLPACPEAIGIGAQPDGERLYAFLARKFTTTPLTPDEIHQIGLKEVARIRAEMDKIIAKVGFKGSFTEFLAHLRTDPRFYYKSGPELFDAYAALSKRIDPELVKLFRLMPRMPYGVRAIPEASAPDTTTAYYQSPAADGSRAGYYYVNLYKPETRPKYEMEALTVHEAVPGHHFQLALAQELGDLPDFRKHTYGFTAFVEGWGLYAESLGEELGLYQDPYSKFGALTYEMWRAVRLVVDTGMHVKGWSRQQAIDYFKANAAKTELDIVNEIDRYIAWPGQALAYKIGQLRIRELRERAAAQLGAKFDVRDFHDVVLGSGTVPLDILERNVDAYIAARVK